MTEHSQPADEAGELHTHPLHSTQRLMPGDLLANRFRITQQLGAGTQATVYAAYDELLEVDIALKLIDTSSALAHNMQTVRNEVVLARKLQHTNIVRVYDAFSDEHWVFFTMQRVNGVPLFERLLQPISRQCYQRWSLQLLQALDTCHQAGIRHGDIKPDNILIDDQDDLLLIDFGIGHTDSDVIQTSGHKQYTAPEIIQTGKPSATSDAYSIGQVLSDMLSAVALSTFSVSDRLWQHRHRRFVDTLTSSVSDARPTVADALRVIERKPSPRSLSVLIALAIAVCLAIVLFLSFRYEESHSPALPDKTLQVTVIHDPAFPLLATMSEMLRYPLIAEPAISLVAAQQSQRLISNLALSPWNNTEDRVDLAATLGADIVVLLEATPTGAQSYLLRGNALMMPADRSLLDVSQSVQTNSLDQDIQTFAEKLVSSLLSKVAAEDTVPDLTFMGALTTSQQAPEHNNEANIVAMQKQYPEYPGAWLAGAQLAFERGDDNAARKQLEQLFDLKSDSSYWHLKGQVLRAKLNDDLALAQQAISQLVEQFPDRPDLLASRADIHLWANNPEGAIADYHRALELAPHNGQLWFELARLMIISGEIEQAMDEYLTRALITFRRAGDTQGEGLVLNAFGVASLRLSDYSAAIRYFREALPLRDASTQPSERATTLANLANVAAINGEFALAERSLTEASQLLEGVGDKIRQAHVLDTLGLLYEEQGRNQEALRYYKQGLDIRVRESHEKQAESMSNVAYMHYLTGDFSLAEIYWQQAASQFERLQDQAHLLRTFQNLAQMNITQGDYRQAARKLNEVAALLKPQQSQEQLYNHLLFSYLHFNQGRPNEALSRLMQARELAEKIGDVRSWAAVVLWHAEVCLMMADWQCTERQVRDLQAQVTEEMQEQYITLGWLALASQYEQDKGQLREEALTQFLGTLDRSSIPVVTELKIRLDIAQRIANQAAQKQLMKVNDVIAPRYAAAYLQWLYLQALQGNESSVLQAQLDAHPGYWRNHLYYRALQTPEALERQPQLSERWLSKLSETQAQQYRQAYLD